MPKSKEILDSDDDLSSNEERPKTKKMKVERKKPEKKASNAAVAEEDENEDQEQASSDTRNQPKQKATKSNASNGGEGKMYMLAKQRFMNVSEFKGKPYINIREYYESNGKTLPGKKGISLSIEQWENLKKHIADVDADLKRF
jgi:hypothetical protein